VAQISFIMVICDMFTGLVLVSGGRMISSMIGAGLGRYCSVGLIRMRSGCWIGFLFLGVC